MLFCLSWVRQHTRFYYLLLCRVAKAHASLRKSFSRYGCRYSIKQRCRPTTTSASSSSVHTYQINRCSFTVSIGVEEVLNKGLDPWLRQHGCKLAEHSLLPYSMFWCRGSLKQRFKPLATSAWVHTCITFAASTQ